MILIAEKDFPMRQYKYIIEMSYSIKLLQNLVNAQIENGYIPHGAPQFALMGRYEVEDRQTYMYMQALVLPEVYKRTTSNGGTNDENT